MSTLTRTERIDHICEMMREFRFVRGVSPRYLAQEWGLSMHTVMKDTAEASRVVKKEIEDPDAVSVDVGTALQCALQGAMKDAQDPEYAGTRHQAKARDQLIQAAKTWSDIMGKSSPQQMEIVMQAAMTPIDAAKAAERLFRGGHGPELEK